MYHSLNNNNLIFISRTIKLLQQQQKAWLMNDWKWSWQYENTIILLLSTIGILMGEVELLYILAYVSSIQHKNHEIECNAKGYFWKLVGHQTTWGEVFLWNGWKVHSYVINPCLLHGDCLQCGILSICAYSFHRGCKKKRSPTRLRADSFQSNYVEPIGGIWLYFSESICLKWKL